MVLLLQRVSLYLESKRFEIENIQIFYSLVLQYLRGIRLSLRMILLGLVIFILSRIADSFIYSIQKMRQWL